MQHISDLITPVPTAGPIIGSNCVVSEDSGVFFLNVYIYEWGPRRHSSPSSQDKLSELKK